MAKICERCNVRYMPSKIADLPRFLQSALEHCNREGDFIKLHRRHCRVCTVEGLRLRDMAKET